MCIALIAPIVTGYRKEALRTSIRVGWGLAILAYLSIDLFVPALAFHFYGREEANKVSPENPGTMAVVVLGWLFPLILHYAGFVLCEFVDALRGLLSKARRN